jgi:hypothetical protein
MSENQSVNLADVPGLGPVRREALAEVGVTDLAGLLAMKVSELAAVRGIGIWQARKVREYLRHEGLLVETPQASDASERDQPIVVHAPETAEQALAVAEAAAVMEAQAEAEAQVEAEVAMLNEALEAANVPETAQPKAKAHEPAAKESAAEEAGAGGVEDESEDEGESEDQETDPREELTARRERLPEVALTLIEAIRQAAVNKQLTRQVTRLLITSGEFVSDSRPLSPEATQAANEALRQAETLLQRALEKEAFGEKEQRELADRIRKRRKALDRLLEQVEVEDR